MTDIIIEDTPIRAGEKFKMAAIRGLTQEGCDAIAELEAFLYDRMYPRHLEPGQSIRLESLEYCGVFIELLYIHYHGLSVQDTRIKDIKWNKLKQLKQMEVVNA